MLEALCSNKNVQRILIFLFVNGRCYGTQLHRLLQTPLTPIQKALLRLEKGGLIVSYYEGKTRVYRFNPAYQLLGELELLLKRAYMLLPAHEKKDYYVVNSNTTNLESDPMNNMQVLLSFWDKLSQVRKLSFNAKSLSQEAHGWSGQGKGEVRVTKEGSNVLIFSEKGSWKGKQMGDITFSNVFRWTLDRNKVMISLEHLRRGPDHPVFLFHLAPEGKFSLSSIESHLCGGDVYFGKIHFDHHSLRLNWRVKGPKKSEEMDYYYYPNIIA